VKLWHATRELHHRAEQHPVGASMADGSIGPQQWADWLGALLTVHQRIDPHLPAHCRRYSELLLDIRDSNATPRANIAAAEYASSLRDVLGAAYVFTGAHLMGGAIMARKLGDRLPVHHLTWGDRAEAIAYLRGLRERDDLADEAVRAFAAVIAIMDEIHAAA
jgi:heme oxygenase